MHYYRYQDIYYSISKLWKLTENIFPIKVNIKTIEYLLYLKNWRDNDGDKINIITVLNNKEKYMHHYQKILNCDLKYPILVQADFRIIDGYHRLAKAIIENKKKILVKLVSPSLLNKGIDKRESNCSPRFIYYPSDNPNLSFVSKGQLTFVDENEAIESLENNLENNLGNSVRYLYIIRGNTAKYVKEGIYKTQCDMVIDQIINI